MPFRHGSRNQQRRSYARCAGKKYMQLSYDDLEGMLVTAGMLGALLLSCVVGLNFTVATEELVNYEFTHLMRYASFRKFVVDVMENEDQDCRKNCEIDGKADPSCLIECNKASVDWMWTDYGEKTVNISEVMLESKDYDKSSQAPKLEVALHMLRPVFPMEKMLAWSASQDESAAEYHPLDAIIAATWWSCALVGSPFLVSVVLYVFLQMSAVRDDEVQEVGEKDLDRWATYGGPLIVALYLCMLAGTALFVWGGSIIMHARAPTPRLASRVNDTPQFFQFAFIGVGFLVALFIYFRSLCAASSDRSTEVENTAAAQDIEDAEAARPVDSPRAE